MPHSGGRIAVILLGALVYAITLALSYLSSTDVIPGLYKNKTGDISDAYYLSVVPAGWAFGLIWGIIYVWNAIWFIYAFTTICRRVGSKYIYQLNILPPAFYVVFMLNNVIVTAWLFLWDRLYLNWALLDIAFTPFTLYICLIISFRGLYNNIQRLEENGASKEIWFVRLFLQNGMAFFATWVSIATLLNFAVVLTYYWGVAMQASSSIVLGILCFEVIVWFILDHFVFDKYVRYTLTPYIVVVVALVGSYLKNYDLDDNYRNSIFIVALLAFSSLVLLLKFVIMFVRARTRPIAGTVSDEVKGGTLA
ncbi:uncharacterized protein LOC128233673 [Mya arenaria]|uniref:uncharacterized protein LOC128233673 n=1 Tax=Mya arenaria TaxID=6604 RepID=UPI0022E699A7|nr:uncharacterized protein LOC128233673 [Mya arenaria]